MKRRLFLALPLIACANAKAHADGASAAANRIFQVIDSMDVEHRWQAGVHINWQTGEPDGKVVLNPERKATHCSAFVAAAAQRLGIYILRPPEHGLKLLANAQIEWLSPGGAQQGWRELPDMAEAQASANRGEFVVAAYHNHHDDRPGHIAIIRPGNKPEDVFLSEGPGETQAGENNHRIVSLKEGFAGHKAAWRDHEIRFFSHAVNLADI